MKKTKEECLLMNGIMSYDLGKNEARIMKAMDDWAEDAVKNLSSNPVLGDSLPSTKCDDCKGDVNSEGECFCNR
jgi:autonomous glycyl radical cofactor GrcA